MTDHARRPASDRTQTAEQVLAAKAERWRHIRASNRPQPVPRWSAGQLVQAALADQQPWQLGLTEVDTARYHRIVQWLCTTGRIRTINYRPDPGGPPGMQYRLEVPHELIPLIRRLDPPHRVWAGDTWWIDQAGLARLRHLASSRLVPALITRNTT